MKDDTIRALKSRFMKWEEIKGQLSSIIVTYIPLESDKFERVRKIIDKFLDEMKSEFE